MAPTAERTVPEGWFLCGLFLTTLATLALEILDTRLLSVLALYHLSFFAVSIAMFGMAAGAVHVYLSGDRFSAAAPAALARWSSWFAISVPVTHVINLIVPVPIHPSVPGTAAIGFATRVLAVPFFLSGVIVTVALTRIRGSIGRTYATDLAGAALGCLLVIPLLRYADISSATFALGALGALGSLCFGRFAGSGGMRLPAVLAVALLAAFVLNGSTRRGFRVIYPKGSYQAPTAVSIEAWNTYSQVVAMKPQTGPPFYWSARRPAGAPRLVTLLLSIDGLAGTLLLGTCFPSGMRLVRPFGERAMPWMWGVNGACGVLASVFAVAISMWAGIEASLAVAVLCYALLPLPARVLASCADGSRGALEQTGGCPERRRASAVGS